MLGPPDVGHRVVVRRQVGHRHGRPLFTDALGELTGLTDTELTVATRTGPVTIARSEVVAAKRVPPRPVTRREIAALEAAANQAWPAPVQEPLGDWLLRAADGWSNRANSALAVGDSGMPTAAAIDEVQRWYEARGLPAAVSVPLPMAARVGAALAARGWDAATPVLVQTAPLAAVRDAIGTTGNLTGDALTLTAAPTGPWLALAAAPGRRRDAEPPAPAALHLLTAGGQVPVRFAHLHDRSGELIAAGRGTVTGGGRWLGLSRVAVVPPARRRGLARRVVAALVDWAGQAGATDAFLQVEEDNVAAVGLYAGLGFSTHHTYVTWRQPRTARRGLVDFDCA